MAGDEATGGVRRRTVIKGAAWSVPVAAVAIAVPARAASDACTGYTVTQEILPASGAWQYVDTITVYKDGVPVDVNGIVATVTFNPPIPNLNATESHNCSVAITVPQQEVVFTGTGGLNMSSTLQLGSGNVGPDRVTGVITVSAPQCPDLVDITEFDIPIVKAGG
ncbi:hypothetical protein ACFVAE_15270 [Microbacterium sp. NPDC057659]|uniref:hypothetical protein n=1 Tax=Microbacterium sp. NPDC057659 TaxID=3346198 RepID=UPI00366E92EB